ncbi:serine protease [Mycolicibacterium sp. J2]|uniref:serine protease n=1 Tax=Mycolicibacterium sp. J2 TaxID=2993511 RepID=UPI00224ABEF7|nr:serine protease [Mycolicibacterium sp. J2]MCX2715234.1 serine protease [Mycolicibacterium sp. J2]
MSLVATAIPAQAVAAAISPGDRIDYVTADGSESFCTTGYVYTGTNGHAYAITAGHCQTNEPGHVVEETTGATGRFISTVVAPARSGGPDYGLIDFGPHVASRTSNDAIGFASDSRPPVVEVGQEVCHLGVSSGTHCGTVAYSYGDDQFMTTGMPASVPGDSGGPVWVTDDGQAHIVGIWLGEKSSADSSRRYGRFASLRAALDILT